MASIDLLGPSGRARFAWLFLRPLAGLELPAVGVGEQAWDWLAGQAGLADDLRPARSPAQQQAEPVAGADDDERGPDKQQRNFEQPAAFAEETSNRISEIPPRQQ